MCKMTTKTEPDGVQESKIVWGWVEKVAVAIVVAAIFCGATAIVGLQINNLRLDILEKADMKDHEDDSKMVELLHSIDRRLAGLVPVIENNKSHADDASIHNGGP